MEDSLNHSSKMHAENIDFLIKFFSKKRQIDKNVPIGIESGKVHKKKVIVNKSVKNK